jgi:hypothetical protein
VPNPGEHLRFAAGLHAKSSFPKVIHSPEQDFRGQREDALAVGDST